MRLHYFGLVLSMLVCISWMQVTGKVDFKTLSHSFGVIEQHSPATFDFQFTNNTGKPLIIKSAVAECGCTDPSYDKKPIGVGKTSTIKVTFKADEPGKFTKKVTVTFINIKDPVILTISGEVRKTEG